MAGGMARKVDPPLRETLAQRVANTQSRQTGSNAGHGTADFHGARPKAPASWTAPPRAQPVPATPPPDLRHCWFHSPWGRLPALLLRWRCIDGHYDGLIVVAALEEDGQGWAVVEMWTSSSLLSPA